MIIVVSKKIGHIGCVALTVIMRFSIAVQLLYTRAYTHYRAESSKSVQPLPGYC